MMCLRKSRKYWPDNRETLPTETYSQSINTDSLEVHVHWRLYTFHSGTGVISFVKRRFAMSSKALSDWNTSGFGAWCVTPHACALPHVPASSLVEYDVHFVGQVRNLRINDAPLRKPLLQVREFMDIDDILRVKSA